MNFRINTYTIMFPLASEKNVDHSQKQVVTSCVPSRTHKIVHYFFSRGILYDNISQKFVSENKKIVSLDVSAFDEESEGRLLEAKHFIDVERFLPCVDLSCCSWFDSHFPSKNLYSFLKYIVSQSGTVRFSDFSIAAGQEFIKQLELPLNFNIIDDLQGQVKIKFNPSDLIESKIEDLVLLGKLAEDGECYINAMQRTRRMHFKNKTVPSYVKILIWICDENGESFPGLIVIQHPSFSGKIIIWSLHFSELSNVGKVDAKKLEHEIRKLEGEASAKQFMKDILESEMIGEDCVKSTIGGALARIVSSQSPVALG